jgi:hypothetical protein
VTEMWQLNKKALGGAEGFFIQWWSGWGSNPRPSHCERDALPAELPPHVSGEC